MRSLAPIALVLGSSSIAQPPIELLDQRSERVYYDKVITLNDSQLVITCTFDNLDQISRSMVVLSRSMNGELLWEDTLQSSTGEPVIERTISSSDGSTCLIGGHISECSFPFSYLGSFLTRYAADGTQLWYQEYGYPRAPWAVLPDGRTIAGQTTSIRTISTDGIDMATYVPNCVTACLRDGTWLTGDTLLVLSDEYLFRFKIPDTVVDTLCAIDEGVEIIRSETGFWGVRRSDDLLLMDTTTWSVIDTIQFPMVSDPRTILLSDSTATFIQMDTVLSYSIPTDSLTSYSYDSNAELSVLDAVQCSQRFVVVGTQHIWYTNGGLLRSYDADWTSTNYNADVTIAFADTDLFYVDEMPAGTFTPYFQGSIEVVNNGPDTLHKVTLDHRRLIYGCGADSDLFPLDTIALAPGESLLFSVPLLAGYSMELLPGDTADVFVCIRAAAPNDHLDHDLSGNYICLSQEVSMPDAISELSSSSFEFLPNPTEDGLIFSSSDGIYTVDLELLDRSGRILLRRRCHTGDYIDITSFAPGTYILRALDPSTGNGATQLVVKL